MQTPPSSSKQSQLDTVLRLSAALAVAFVGAFATFKLIQDGFFPLASLISAITVFVFLVVVKKSLTPYRWLATGIILALLFTIFPIVYTVYLSFTNMSGGHLLTKEQAISRLGNERYTPADASIYSWYAYGTDTDNYELLLSDSEGRTYRAIQGQDPQAHSWDPLTEPPASLDGKPLLDPVLTLQSIQVLSELNFGSSEHPLAVIGMGEAAIQQPRLAYDPAAETMTDRETGTIYTAVDGTFVSPEGEQLIPGFMVGTGFDNYTRFLGNDGYRKPLLQILVWNFLFAILSVGLSFGLGLMIALLFENLPGRRIIRSLLIIPYPIPVLVSIMVWRGLLNEQMGLVTSLFTAVFGWAPAFFTDVNAVRFAVILINVYLSYPYFYILASGALKSIPRDMYEAADIDGASPFQALRHITMPMLLRILMPLLIASFSFNFNNFTIIWAYNAGNPPIADTLVTMGHTDLLISLIYRLGFNSNDAADYGFSAAITVILFVFVGLMVFFQTRNTKSIKEAN